MGCFSINCSISGLGINAGDPVHCLLLSKLPPEYKDARNEWYIRTPPIRAKYDDYGSITDVLPQDKSIADLWLRGLSEDAHEIGIGNNEYHDVAVTRSMTFTEMLTAISEQRLEVIQDSLGSWRRPILHKYDIGENVGNHIKSTLLSKVQKKLKSVLYIIDEPNYNIVRIRGSSGLTDNKLLALLVRAKKILEKNGLNGVVVPDKHSVRPMLLVFYAPHKSINPDAYECISPALNENPDKASHRTLKVRLAIIRSDVWVELVKFPQSQSIYKELPTFTNIIRKKGNYRYAWYDSAAYKDGVRKIWKFLHAINKTEPAFQFFGKYKRRDYTFEVNSMYDMPGVYDLYETATYGTIGIIEHFLMLISTGVSTLSENLINNVGELLAIRNTLRGVGVMLKPAESTGPQIPEWGESARFANMVAAIADKQRKKLKYKPSPLSIDEV